MVSFCIYFRGKTKELESHVEPENDQGAKENLRFLACAHRENETVVTGPWEEPGMLGQ